MTEQVLLIAQCPAPVPLSLANALTAEGYRVEAVHAAGGDAVKCCLRNRPDLIVVVAGEEAAPSLELCRELRAHSVSTPCLLLTPGEGEAAAALRCGADDCLAGQVDPAELLARIEALLRRSRRSRETVLAFGGITVDVRRRRAATPRGAVDLSPKEVALLAYLAAQAGMIVPREELLREVWGYSVLDTRTVDTHLASLRRKLEEEPRRPSHLLTIRGRGYQFVH